MDEEKMLLAEIKTDLRLIIFGMENYMEDEFEVHYQTDAENTLKDLKELMKKIEKDFVSTFNKKEKALAKRVNKFINRIGKLKE